MYRADSAGDLHGIEAKIALFNMPFYVTYEFVALFTFMIGHSACSPHLRAIRCLVAQVVSTPTTGRVEV